MGERLRAPGLFSLEKVRGDVTSSGDVQNPPGCFPVRPALGNLRSVEVHSNSCASGILHPTQGKTCSPKAKPF